MRYPLIIAGLLLFAAGCDKDKVPTPQLPAFSCNSADDDGKFEDWNSKEQTLVRGIFNIKYPAAKQDGYVQYLSLSGTPRLKSSDSLYITYVQTNDVWFHSAIVFSNGHVGRTRGFYFSRSSPPDTVKTAIWQGWDDTLGVVGCARLYYVFTDTTGLAVDKGHFDINVK